MPKIYIKFTTYPEKYLIKFTSFVNIYSACLIDTGVVISVDALSKQFQ